MSVKSISFTFVLAILFTLSGARAQDDASSTGESPFTAGSLFLTKAAQIGPTSAFLFSGSSYLDPEIGDKFRGEIGIYVTDKAELSVSKLDRVANMLAAPQGSPSWGIRFQLLSPDAGRPAVAAGLISSLEWTNAEFSGKDQLAALGVYELKYQYFLTDFSVTATKTFGSSFLINGGLSYQKLNYRNFSIWHLPLEYDRNYSRNTDNFSKGMLQAFLSANLRIRLQYALFLEVQSIPALLPVAGSDNLEFARAYQGSLNFRYYFLDNLGFDIGIWHQDDFKNISNTQIWVGLNALVFI